MTIEEAEEIVRRTFDAVDGCGSCGWKSLLYEHEPLDIDQADIDRGYVRFPCFSEDASENGGHRGIRVYLRDPDQSNAVKANDTKL